MAVHLWQPEGAKLRSWHFAISSAIAPLARWLATLAQAKAMKEAQWPGFCWA
ncbi:hypothetical protein D9M69_352010 [compost metagenome]